MDVIALLLILAFVFWIQMLILCKYVFYKLEYSCEFSVSEAHEGDTISVVETVYNGKLLPVPWLRADIHTSKWLDYAETCSVIAQENRHVTSSFALRSYQKVTRKWKLKCLKRGIFRTENVSLVSGDLLNFHTVSIAVSVNAELTVYPETIDLDSYFIPISLQQSDTVVSRHIIDDPFIVSGARDYTPGDPLNRIHWPASAKSGKLMVRKNEYTSQQKLSILLNMQSKLYEYADTIDKTMAELGIKVAATLLDDALREGRPVRFITNGCTSADARAPIVTGEAAGRDHITSVFRILAGLLMKNVKDFEAVLDDVSGELTNTEVVIITAYLSGEICRQADRLAAEGARVSIMLLDTVFENSIKPQLAELYVLSEMNRIEAQRLYGDHQKVGGIEYRQPAGSDELG
jgi:uncharacterized protein (DUF58 family)